MTERIASVLMVLAGVYGGSWFAINEPKSSMLWLFVGLTLLSIWTVHTVWTAEVFEDPSEGQ